MADRDFTAADKLADPAEISTAVVVGHIRPDADAIGSVCATVAVLRQRGIDATGVIGQREPIATNLYTIPGCADIQLVERLPEADLVVTVDCGDLGRTGTCAEGIGAHDRVLVIDHHSSNTGFGTVDVIDPAAESTTAILHRWFTASGDGIDRDVAHALYAGLVTDTGSFRWGGAGMHLLAADLIGRGVDTRAVAVDLMDATTPESLRIIGRVLAGVETHPDGPGVTVLTADHATITETNPETIESLTEFIRATGQGVGVLLKENLPGVWSVSFRSTDHDVASVATSLGGGGHLLAAGATVRGTRGTVLAAVRRAVGGHAHPYTPENDA
ncbi:DHH family phosphoesterase [Corynebacterium sp. P7202]|uniref:DHH family phosphoesterase n=1 Tax=Corynebacterium pygosceleis TaxID=2800406 RepID=A0A9Q4GIY8_9CORY|nr:DHH family phosphoesterase [Corynebacterium pygosceleis]MCK7636816.1 DHH family phosphoesterase [Corynebacterium pygosceleis]MCX7467569.1 DHH family phosphoesterase [Corynebacterium pygosceleis]